MAQTASQATVYANGLSHVIFSNNSALVSDMLFYVALGQTSVASSISEIIFTSKMLQFQLKREKVLK
jgi:hypothetical protein